MAESNAGLYAIHIEKVREEVGNRRDAVSTAELAVAQEHILAAADRATQAAAAAPDPDPVAQQAAAALDVELAVALAEKEELLAERAAEYEKAAAILKEITKIRDEDFEGDDKKYNVYADLEAKRMREEREENILANLEAEGKTRQDLLDEHKAAFDKCMSDAGHDAAGSSADSPEFAADYDKCNKEAAKATKKKADELAKPKPEYMEQCFLLANIFQLVQYKKKQDASSGPYRKKLPYVPPGRPNASLLIDGDPYIYMNLLTQYPSALHLFDLKTEEISQLQPMIRLYKLRELPNYPYETLQEFRFYSNLTHEERYTTAPPPLDMLKDSKSRGVGVGIKNFTFSYEADNPFAVKKSIKAKLTLFANSFDELLRDRSTPAEEEWTYADLALKTGSPLIRNYTANRVGGDQVYDIDKLDFRLKAVVGWAIPGGNTALSSESRDAIYNSYVSLNLTPTIHEFDIDELGRVTFSINYLAYVEDFFDQPSFNIFTDAGVAQSRLERKLQYKTMVADCTKAKKLNEKKEKWKDDVASDRKTALKSILKKMHGDPCPAEEEGTETVSENPSKIYFLELDYDEVSDFQSQGPYYPQADITTSILTEPSDDLMAGLLNSVDAELEDPEEKKAATGEAEKEEFDELPEGGMRGTGDLMGERTNDEANVDVNSGDLSDSALGERY